MSSTSSTSTLRSLNTNLSLDSFQSNNTNKYNIEKFMLHTPTKSEESILEDHVLRIIVSNGLAFKWIENEEVKSLFKWLNPNIRLPNRKALWKNLQSKNIIINAVVTDGASDLFKPLDTPYFME